MSRVRNNNPYDVRGWTGEIEITQEDLVPLPVATSTLFLPADPMRLWILLAHSSGAGQAWYWPITQTGPYGITSSGNGNAVLIHNASYPSLVQSTWYGWSQGAITNVHVIVGTVVSSRR